MSDATKSVPAGGQASSDLGNKAGRGGLKTQAVSMPLTCLIYCDKSVHSKTKDDFVLKQEQIYHLHSLSVLKVRLIIPLGQGTRYRLKMSWVAVL